jgi:N-acyl-D-aspartate/D-glutamate deacylase
MHDIVIRGGTIVDGTGAVPFTGDVAVRGNQIVEVGMVTERGRREIDADGLLVTPGFVDIHTHYDGQAIWDSELAPSSRHGVTTTLFGNCGVGFAPVRPSEIAYLMDLMEGVEDIPGSVLAEGVDFSWESFPEYLDVLASKAYSIDIGTFVPHSPLRLYVMGPRGSDHEARATPEQVAEMGKVAAEAMRAGAFGFSTSRTQAHRSLDGRYVPSLTAPRDELLGITGALGALGRGVVQVVSDITDPRLVDTEEEFRLLRSVSQTSGMPLTLGLIQLYQEPEVWRTILDRMNEAVDAGINMSAQVAPRAIGILCGFEASTNPFASKASYRSIAGLPLAERVRELSRPERRTAILAEELGNHRFTRMVHDSMDRIFELGSVPDYEPDPKSSIAARAGQLNISPHELAYDIMLQNGGRELLFFAMNNYVSGNLDDVGEMLRHPRTIIGLSDGGAHVGVLCDASFPTYLISHWSRDRVRGERLPVETCVKMLTRETASLVGLADRGVVRPGLRADLNVIDFERLGALKPTMVYDLPAGGRRLIQEAVGYRHTLCGGVETFTDGAPTGARPGRLVRSGS